MASVYIYPEHRDILDEMISSGKVASAGASVKTGPFRDQRDAYVFAVGLSVALDSRAPDISLPESRSDATPIRDSVFLGAVGANELLNVICLINSDCSDSDDDSDRSRLIEQLELIGDGDLEKKFDLLDRYAYQGFDWLERERGDHATVGDLLSHALISLELSDIEEIDMESIKDPLMDFLL